MKVYIALLKLSVVECYSYRYNIRGDPNTSTEFFNNWIKEFHIEAFSKNNF